MQHTWTFPSILPKDWFDENYVPISHADDFQKVARKWEEAFKTKEGRLLKSDFRGKIFNFVERNGYIAEGRTNVNIMGTYLVGTAPNYNQQIRERAVRTLGEQLYASALVDAFNSYAQETGFKHAEDDNYSSREDALMAIEADSLGSKGPYDNGAEDQALQTVSTVLASHLGSKQVEPGDYPVLDQALQARFDEYARYVDKQYHARAAMYVEHMKNRGLSRTMRGFPFMMSGDKTMDKRWIFAINLMFDHLPFVMIPKEDVKHILTLTIDQTIEWCLNKLDVNGITVEQWYTLDHAFIIPISRNQGSPFKVKWKDGKLVLTGERKDMKYRLVTPMSAFVQARCILAVDSLVRNAKYTTGRIGLQDPNTNVVKMNDFIRESHEALKVLISTDFTAYDSTLAAQQMAAHCNMYSYLFDDEWVKDGMRCAALSLCHKIMLLPCYLSDKDQPYANFDRYFMRSIKGIASFSNAKAGKGSPFTNKARDEMKRTERFDFCVWAFYVYKGYLPSGHILTNATGSDCTLCMSRYLVPSKMGDKDIQAIGSGDDCVQQMSRWMYENWGLEKTYEQLEKAYAYFGMIVNAQKQIRILYKGLPMVDFLQHPYIQGEDAINNQPQYNKFMRQAPSLPYTERRSNLGPILQWNIVLGKGEAGVCAENSRFAAEILVRAGTIMHGSAKKKKFQPIVHSGLMRIKDGITWDKAYTVGNSALLGLEQLIGLSQQYNQGLISALGKYAAGKLDSVVQDFDKELETRAPHREGFAKAFFKAMGQEAYDEAGGDGRFGDSVVPTHFHFIDTLNFMREISGVTVRPVVLDQPLIGAGILADGQDATDDDTPEDYEFDIPAD
jgi:hypothetical protein